jgi:hypothetical protein
MNTPYFLYKSKFKVMKTTIIKQEILLMIAPFTKKEWCKKDAPNAINQSYAEQLEKACWNCLFDELLDGIVEKTPFGKRLGIWNIHKEKSFLEIDLCNSLHTTEKQLSVNP